MNPENPKIGNCFRCLLELRADSKRIASAYPSQLQERDLKYRYGDLDTRTKRPLLSSSGFLLLGRFDLCVDNFCLFEQMSSNRNLSVHWAPQTQNIFQNTLELCSTLAYLSGLEMGFFSEPAASVVIRKRTAESIVRIPFTDMEGIEVTFKKESDGISISGEVPRLHASFQLPRVSYDEFARGSLTSLTDFWKSIGQLNPAFGGAEDIRALHELFDQMKVAVGSCI